MVGEFPLAGALSDDPSPDLLDTSPGGERVYVSLRGSLPLSGDPHASTGSTPGVGVIDVEAGGRSGELRAIARDRERRRRRRRSRRPARAEGADAVSSGAADGPGRGALPRVEHGGTAILLGLGGRGGVAGAADALPRLLRELVLAVEPVAGVGRRVAAGLAGGDRLEVGRGGAGRGARRACAGARCARAGRSPAGCGGGGRRACGPGRREAHVGAHQAVVELRVVRRACPTGAALLVRCRRRPVRRSGWRAPAEPLQLQSFLASGTPKQGRTHVP